MRAKLHSALAAPTPLYVAFAALLALTVGVFAFVTQQAHDYSDARRSLEKRRILYAVFIDLLDAETGQRGYLLTDNRDYLNPYTNALGRLNSDFKSLADVTDGTSGEQSEFASLLDLADQKLTELRTTIDLQDAKRSSEALALVNANIGKNIMEQIRTTVEDLIQRERQRIDSRFREAEKEGDLLSIFAFTAILFTIAVGVDSMRRLRRQLNEIIAARDGLREANAALLAEAEQRAKIAQQLRQSQKMEAIGQLTGGLAHDFNNMLSVIISGISLAKRNLAREDGNPQRYLDAAVEGAERAATLTHRLLAFSRQQPLSPEPVDPNKLVGGMAELLHRSLGESVRLETVLGAGLWRTHADASQLESALLNLAVNARDAMPEGGKLTIETNNAFLDDEYTTSQIGVPAGQYVLIAVTDTGVGMSRDILEHAFDPFFTTKPPGKGTGLGLSQVYGFIRQSGGHIKIYSEPGHGTTVKIYLPRHYDEGVAARAAPLTVAPARGGAQETILVVEDDERVRRLAADTLAELGYRVLQADGAADGLRQLSELPVDLLFTDIIMSDTNGRTLADEARKHQPGLKVLFTTGYTQNAIVHGGILDPGVDLIVKPYSIDRLARKIREILDRPVP